MAAPILKIPVDDSAFKRFMEAFGKYQENLKGQPEMWKDVNREAANFAALGASIVTDINNQIEATQQLAEEEAKRQEAAEKAERRLQQLEQDKQDRRQKAIETMKKSYKTLVGLAADFAKWSIGAGLAGGVMTFGLEHVAGKIGNERREAQGAGISIGQRRAMNLTMQRYYDVNSVVGNVANMQADPSQWATFSQMGVNPRGKDPAELSLEVARRAAEMFTKDKGNLALAQAQGLTNIFTPEDLRRLADALKSGELGRSQQEYGGLKSKFQLSDRDAKTWQDFDKRINEASMTLQKFFTDKISVMVQNGSLDKIINSFEKLAEAGIDAFADIFSDQGFQQAVSDFADEIKSPEFQKSLKNFAQAIGEIANILVKFLPTLKYLSFQNLAKENKEIDTSIAQKFGRFLPELWVFPLIDDIIGRLGGADSNNTATGRENASYTTKYSPTVKGRLSPNFSALAARAGDAFANDLGGRPGNGSVADRNNNPGNMMSGKSFIHFPDLKSGASAMARQLLRDYDVHGQKTIEQIINDPQHGWSNEWAKGNSHQSALNYIERLSKGLGIKPNQDLNLHDDRVLEKLMIEMNKVERKTRKPATHFKHDVHLRSHTGQSIATTLHTASI